MRTARSSSFVTTYERRSRRVAAPGLLNDGGAYCPNASQLSRESPHVVWVRSLVPKEKKSGTAAICRAVGHALGNSIIVRMTFPGGSRFRQKQPR